MEVQVGDRIMTKGVGSTAGFLTGQVVEINGKIVRFRQDEGQSEHGVRPVFSRLIHQVTKLT